MFGAVNIQFTPDMDRKINIGDVYSAKNDELMVDREICESDYSSKYITENIIQNKISPKLRALTSFLNDSCITEKGSPNTNLINVLTGKTYNLPNTSVGEFFTLLEHCRIDNRSLHFTERQVTSDITHSGIMIDFDRIQHSRKSQFTATHFKKIAMYFGKLLEELCDIPQNDFTFHAFFIQKPEPALIPSKSASDIPLYKDGIHVLIPDVWLTKTVKKYIIGEFIKREFITRIFSDIDHIGAAEDMLDKMSPSVPVHFLGNSKVGKPAYHLKCCYRYVTDGVFPNYDLIDADALSKKTCNFAYELSLSFMVDQIGETNTWLRKKKINCHAHLAAKIENSAEKRDGGIIADEDLYEVENTVDLMAISNPEANYLQQLLGIIDISYATTYERWFKVICAIAHTSKNYKQLAVWFSQRQPNSWSQAEVDRVWREACANSSRETPLTKRSIIYWARTSSPEQFRQIDSENYVNILGKFVYTYDGVVQNGMVAKILHSMLRMKFVVMRDTNNKYVWYEFIDAGQSMTHGEVYKWRKEFDPINLHLYISDHIPKIYEEQAQRINDKKTSCEDVNLAKFYSKLEKTFKSSEVKLYDDAFQNKIILQAQYRFYDHLFAEQLDKYPEIIGVGNGVLRLGVNPLLITGFHEYKISKFIPTDYIPYDAENPYIKRLLQVFRDIFIEEDVFLFAMCHAATGLDGRAAAFLIWLIDGGGSNGKSTYFKMVFAVLTSLYCCPAKSTLLTSGFEKANDTNSALAALEDKRWTYADEFEPNVPINTSRIKNIVGGGVTTTRDVFKSQSSFKNTSNIVAGNNFQYLIPTDDHGTWRRIYCYTGKIKFTANPNPNNKYEKKADPDIENKYPEDDDYKRAMLSIMVHYWSILERDFGGSLSKIPVPTIVRETEIFRNTQDKINRFITQMVVRSNNSEDIPLEKLCILYGEWHFKSMNKKLDDTISSTRTRFENSKLAKMITRLTDISSVVRGCRIKTNVDEPLQLDESCF